MSVKLWTEADGRICKYVYEGSEGHYYEYVDGEWVEPEEEKPCT